MVFLIVTRFSPSFSVKHPPYKEALDKYIFQMAGQRLLDDQLVYDISVKPKNKLFSGFVGRISILDNEYAMIEADLSPGQSFFFPPPVHDLKLSTTQKFARFGDEFWLPVGMQMGVDISVGFIGLEFPNISTVMLTRLSNYSAFGVTADSTVDSLGAPGPVTPIEERIVRKGLNDSLLVQQGKIIPLSTDEQCAY